MGCKMARDAYEDMIAENIAWLEYRFPGKSLIKSHIIDVLRASVHSEYDQKAEIERLRGELTSIVDTTTLGHPDHCECKACWIHGMAMRALEREAREGGA